MLFNLVKFIIVPQDKMSFASWQLKQDHRSCISQEEKLALRLPYPNQGHRTP